jgi:hypothetical protein
MLQRSKIIATLLVLGLSVTAAGARAEVTAQDRAAAQVLFDQGKDLMKGNDVAAACAKFEESQRLDPRIATQFQLAACLEKLGRTASAWTNFVDVAATTKAAGQKDREAVARQRADALKKKLSYITFEVSSPPQGLTVTRDGAAVGAALWSTPVPTDPGQHTIEARAPGKQPWQATVTVKPSGDQVRVKIPALEDAPTPPEGPRTTPETPSDSPPPSGTAGPAPSVPVTGPAPDTGSPGSTQRSIGWSLGAVGLSAGVVGGVFGILAMSANDASKGLCRTPDFCSQEGLDRNREAKERALVSTILFAAGGAALGAGVVVLLTAPGKRKVEAAAVRAAPWLGPGAGGTTVVVTW